MSRTRYLSARYRLTSQQVHQLKTILFAQPGARTARAKFDLYAKMRPEHITEVQKDPRSALVRVLSEIDLTHIEVLATLFMMETSTLNEFHCPACMTMVSFDPTLYHVKCSVIQFLEDEFRFTYDEKQRCLQPQKAIYLKPTQRKLLTDVFAKVRAFDTTVLQNTERDYEMWNTAYDRVPLKALTISKPKPIDITSTTRRK